MRHRLAPAVLLALILGACAADGDSAADPGDGTPQEQADRVAQSFYEDNRKPLDAIAAAFPDNEGDTFDRFEPDIECAEVKAGVKDEDAGMMAMYFGQVLADAGTDVASFLGEIREYNAAILETGVCG